MKKLSLAAPLGLMNTGI